MRSVIKYYFLVSLLTLSSCFFGPAKELKYQIEDSFTGEDNEVVNPTPLNEISNKINSSIAWQTNIDDIDQKNLKFFVNNNVLFVPTSNNQIFILDIVTGNEIGNIELEHKIISGLSGDNDNLYFVDSDGFLNSINHNGSYNWRSFVGEVYSNLLPIDNKIFVKTTNSIFISLKKNDGSILWNYKAPTPPLTIRSWGDIKYSDDILYSGISSGKIIALDSKTGSLVWEATYSEPRGTSDIDRANDSASAPIIGNTFLYIVSTKGHLASLVKTGGDIIWKRPFSSFYGLSDNNESLISIHNSGVLYSFDKESSKVNWRNSVLKGRAPNFVIILENIFLVGDYEGYIHFFNIENGKNIGRTQFGNTYFVDTHLVAESNNIILSNQDGNIFSINLDKKIILSNDNEVNMGDEDLNNEESKKDPSVWHQDPDFIDNLIFWD